MKNMRLHLLALSCMAALAVAAQPVLAGNGNSASGSVNAGSAIASHLVTRYASFAGSQSNAGALVAGLRTGTPIVLTGSGSGSGGSATQTTITPATRAMGYGEVNTALALAQAELVKYGISNPSPQQIQAALNGGTVTTANGVAALSGVLAMRQSGQGWGRIANHLGYNLGSLVSATETGNSQAGMHGSVAAGLDVGGHGHGAGASADAAANASMRARVGVPANLPQRPNLPAVVRPNLPIHIGVGVGGGI